MPLDRAALAEVTRARAADAGVQEDQGVWCYPAWFDINAGNGRQWRYDANGNVNANASDASTGREWFQLCYDPDWDVSHWAIHANGRGWLQPAASGRLNVNGSEPLNASHLFQWCDFDTNFSTFRSVSRGRRLRVRSDLSGAPVYADSTLLTAAELHRVVLRGEDYVWTGTSCPA